jgi:hypothetical protein
MYQSRCTAKNSSWWAERLPETCKVIIPIKLEFSASVDLIHKEATFNIFRRVFSLKTPILAATKGQEAALFSSLTATWQHISRALGILKFCVSSFKSTVPHLYQHFVTLFTKCLCHLSLHNKRYR